MTLVHPFVWANSSSLRHFALLTGPTSPGHQCFSYIGFGAGSSLWLASNPHLLAPVVSRAPTVWIGHSVWPFRLGQHQVSQNQLRSTPFLQLSWQHQRWRPFCWHVLQNWPSSSLPTHPTASRGHPFRHWDQDYLTINSFWWDLVLALVPLCLPLTCWAPSQSSSSTGSAPGLVHLSCLFFSWAPDHPRPLVLLFSILWLAHIHQLVDHCVLGLYLRNTCWIAGLFHQDRLRQPLLLADCIWFRNGAA